MKLTFKERSRALEIAEKSGIGYSDLDIITLEPNAWPEDVIDNFGKRVVLDCIEYLREEAERLYALRHDDGDLLAEKCYDNIEGLKERFQIDS